MKIEDYLNKHKILKIGSTIPGYICCETIVDNPKELIHIVRQNDCYISEIRWWDRVEIISGSKIGYGGPKDPYCPDFYFAETDICKQFDISARDEEYSKYIDEIHSAYPNLLLFPAFDIKRYEKSGKR